MEILEKLRKSAEIYEIHENLRKQMKITEKILILANGEFPKREKALKLLDSNLSLICCDGAANKCYSAGYKPDIIIGDIDSLDSKLKNLFQIG